MAVYEESIRKAIAAGILYEDLPPKLQYVTTPQEWKTKVKDYGIAQGKPWSVPPISQVCTAQEYYEELLRAYVRWHRLFPYHLADYVCRVMRVTPFRYYTDVLYTVVRDEKSYDRLPNFTAADILRHVGIGRNEYISLMNHCKGRKGALGALWKVNKGAIARELLPAVPLDPKLEPWWRACCVNIGETEFRELTVDEVAVVKTAALPEGARVGDLDPSMLTSLYRRSLLYIEVPIRPVDRFAIPPLEGFVSNRTSEQGDSSVDPLEALLYSLFVANSERLTIAQLAGILNVDIGSLTTAMSVACRLGFATRASHEELRSVMAPLPPLPPPGSAPGTPHRGLRGSGGSLLVDQEEYEMDDLGDSGSVRATPGAISSSATITYAPQPLASRQPAGGLLDSGTSSGRLFPSSASTAGGGGSSSVAQSVAIVLDAEATSFLMMGALSPGLKRHSVTLFEGGRVAGEAVIKELIAELWVSYEAGQGFEGDMRALTDYAAAMATLLEMVRAASGQMEVELLRKESLEGLAPAAACKVLAHAYCAVVPITPLPHPPLPLAPASSSPLFLGASNEAAAPWLQLALYASARAGPVSLVLLCGQRLWRLPAQLERCTHALVWPWDVDQLGSGGNSGGGGGQDASQRVQLVESAFLLGALNDLLTRTAVMVQPLSVAGVPDAASIAEVLQVVDVPLPLPPPLPTAAAAAAAVGEEASRGSSGGSVELEGVEHPSLAPCAVTLPASTCQALRDLGLSRCLGFLRLYRIAGGGQQGTDVDGSAELPGFAATAADDGSGKEAAWQPLYVQLGVPLYCLPLCKAVCGAALRHDAGFLTTPGRASALAGLEQLHSHLDGLVAEYGLCARWLNDAGSGRQLGHVVEFPAHNLLFDGLSVHKVGLTDCLQGVGFTR